MKFLAKSRAKIKIDIYEQEILKQAYAVITLMVLATLFFVVQICVGGGHKLWNICNYIFWKYDYFMDKIYQTKTAKTTSYRSSFIL